MWPIQLDSASDTLVSKLHTEQRLESARSPGLLIVLVEFRIKMIYCHCFVFLIDALNLLPFPLWFHHREQCRFLVGSSYCRFLVSLFIVDSYGRFLRSLLTFASYFRFLLSLLIVSTYGRFPLSLRSLAYKLWNRSHEARTSLTVTEERILKTGLTSFTKTPSFFLVYEERLLCDFRSSSSFGTSF